MIVNGNKKQQIHLLLWRASPQRSEDISVIYAVVQLINEKYPDATSLFGSATADAYRRIKTEIRSYCRYTVDILTNISG